jgi:hypothetical protein
MLLKEMYLANGLRTCYTQCDIDCSAIIHLSFLLDGMADLTMIIACAVVTSKHFRWTAFDQHHHPDVLETVFVYLMRRPLKRDV